MKIIYQHLFENQPSLTDTEETIISILEDDDYFEKKVKEIRKKFGISEDSFKKNIYEKDFKNEANCSYVKDLEYFFKKQSGDVLIRNTYNLYKEYYFPPSWMIAVYMLTKYNVFYIFKPKQEIDVFKGNNLAKAFLEKDSFLLQNSVFIKVNPYINKTNFISYIDRIYKKQIEPLLIKPKALLNKNIPNLPTYKRIFQLRKAKMTFPKISEIIQKEFGKEFSDSDLRQMFKRYKNQIRSLRKGDEMKK